MRGRWLPMALVGLAWGALLLRIASLWDRLPLLMATHFGPSGRPDGWMSRQGFLLFTLLVEGGVTLVLVTLPALLRRLPVALINLPDRDYWLAPERRADSLARLGVWMSWLAVAVAALLVGVNELLLRANLDIMPLAVRPFFVLLGAFVAFFVGWMIAFFRAFRPPAGA